MTVSSEISSISYAGDGVTVAFAFPYNFLANSDLQVATRDANGDTVIIVTGFSTVGAGTGSGTVTFTVAPAVGTSIIISRVPAILQPVDYVANDKFPAETHEQALDRETYISQFLYEITQRCLRLPSGDSSAGSFSELPVASSRKGNVLAFNSSTGKPEMLAVGSISGLTTALTSSIIGLLVNPRSGEEITALVTPADYARSYFDPLRNGAVGDGVTEDTIAWNNAIATAAVMGATIRPARAATFFVDTLVMASNVKVDLNGSTLKLKAHATTKNPVIRIGTAAAAANRVTIRNGKIDGNASAQTFGGEQFSPGIYVWGSDYALVDTVEITNCQGDGITSGYDSGRVVGSNGCRYTNCEIYGNNTSRQCIAVTYGDEGRIDFNKCSGNIDLELNAGIGEIKNWTVFGNRGRSQTESLLTPRISDLQISLASVNIEPRNYFGNIISGNHCYLIKSQYNDGFTITGNVVVGSNTTQTYLIDLAGGKVVNVTNNQLYINAAVATAMVAALRTRAIVNLTVTDNNCDGDTSGIPFHSYVAGFGAEPTAAGHVFRNNQTSSGYYRNTTPQQPSEWARFRIDQTNGGALAITQVSGVNCFASISRSGATAIITSVGGSGSGWTMNILPQCHKTAAASADRPDQCAYTFTTSGSSKTVTMFTYTPAASAVTEAAFSFASAGGTGTFDLEVYF